MRNAAEGESSAAIAERVVDEVMPKAPLLLGWDDLSGRYQEFYIALVDAGRAAASSPRTIPPLTDAEVAREKCGRGPGTYQDAFRHFYALAASRLGATVAAPGAMPEKQAQIFDIISDLDATKREAAQQAWYAGVRWCMSASKQPPETACGAYLANTYPATAPVPEPPSVTVTPVEYEWHDDGYRKQVYAEKETGRIVGSIDDQNAYIVGSGLIGRYVTPQQARDAVVRVLALREGRGDDAQG